MDDTFAIVVGLIVVLIPIAALTCMVFVLLRHIDRLENKLMARDLTEYTVQNKNKIGNSPNFIKDAIKASYKERGERDGS